jgi:hypothetical protein
MSMSSGQLDSIDKFSSISVNDASSRLVSFAIVQQQADALYANFLLPYIYAYIQNRCCYCQSTLLLVALRLTSVH